MPGFPILHYLPEFAQTHIHWVNDAIQPSHRLPPPFLLAFSLSQHQGLFQWVDSLYQVAKSIEVSASVLPMNIQDWFPLGWTGWTSLQSKRRSRVSPISQFKTISSFVLSLLYGTVLTSVCDYWKNHIFVWIFVGKVMSLLFNTLSRLVIAFLSRSSVF